MIIFSVEQASQHPVDNQANSMEMLNHLRFVNAKYAVLEGVYKGIRETSFITNQFDLGRTAAKSYNQESYLERGHKGVWYLVDTQSDTILDWFRTICEVSEEEAKRHDSYSVMEGKFYVGRK